MIAPPLPMTQPASRHLKHRYACELRKRPARGRPRLWSQRTSGVVNNVDIVTATRISLVRARQPPSRAGIPYEPSCLGRCWHPLNSKPPSTVGQRLRLPVFLRLVAASGTVRYRTGGNDLRVHERRFARSQTLRSWTPPKGRLCAASATSPFAHSFRRRRIRTLPTTRPLLGI